MAYNLGNSNRRRQPELNHEPKTKHRKQIGAEVNATDADVITNMCNELLDRIFDFLDPQSLLNMAGTCKRLQIAAAAKYGQKFGRYITILCSEKNHDGDLLPKHGTLFEDNMLQVFRLTALPFLRCFGAQISELHVVASDNKYIARYINQYCADTLTKISTNDFDKEAFTLENCPKPFKLVESVDIGNLFNQFSNFPNWFPNMRKLSFRATRFDFDISSAVFPHLEELSCIAVLNSDSEKKQIERFVRANPQLRYLWIDVNKLWFSSLLEMLSKHTSISKLVAGDMYLNNEQVESAQLLRFAKEHRELVELDFDSYTLEADDAVALVRELSSLKHFLFRLKDLAECHYLENQLEQVIGFMFDAKSSEFFLPLIVVELRINR